MYGGKYVKHYTNEELDTKIHTFLNKKFEKYPELTLPPKSTPVFSKPSFTTRMIHSLVNGTLIPSN